jgi:hypothetical protein
MIFIPKHVSQHVNYHISRVVVAALSTSSHLFLLLKNPEKNPSYVSSSKT